MKPSALEQEIAAIIAARVGRPCLFVPSGRIAVLLALRNWLSPGDRVLMSPLTDDVIFFIALAAGLRPVMAPLARDDANIDVAAVSEDTWRSIAGVLTTNLYGIPDRLVELRARCDRSGIVLIEDAAHSLEIEADGQPVGTFGEVAAFSLAKHVGAVGGGVLSFRDEARRGKLASQCRAAMVEATRGDRLKGVLEQVTWHTSRALQVRDLARRANRWMGLDERATGDRMALRAPRLREAVASVRDAAGGDERRHGQIGRDLDCFESWTRVDLHQYRRSPPTFELKRILTRLHALDRDRARRIQGVERLRELGVVAPAANAGPALPLFRVPLLLENRDVVRAELQRRNLSTEYLYDPPLDDYAGPEFAEPSTAPQVARWWARHVLPVDPLEAERVVHAVRSSRLRLIRADVADLEAQPVSTAAGL